MQTTRALTATEIIDLLRQKQGEKTDLAFAEELGIHNSYLSRLYAGQIPVGRKLAHALARRYPELSVGLGLFLLGDLEQCKGPGKDARRD